MSCAGASNGYIAAPAPKAAGAKAKSGGKPKKVGPNDACPCGSGKKYKKCHGGPRQKGKSMMITDQCIDIYYIEI